MCNIVCPFLESELFHLLWCKAKNAWDGVDPGSFKCFWDRIFGILTHQGGDHMVVRCCTLSSCDGNVEGHTW
jgi:hypothetical protein